MHIVAIDSRAPDPTIIARAAALLREGRLVAFPTETVYGLGANALDPSAVERIYEAKGRPSYNPLIVHIASTEQARDIVSEWNDRAEQLAQAFWPGPLSLVLPKRSSVPSIVTAGLDAVAVRVPAHPVALALLEACALPLAAPSANRSMMLSPTTGEHVARSLGDAVDLILDAGPTQVGIESTVLNVSTDPPTLLRPGMISVAEIEGVIGLIEIATRANDAVARPSPGMSDRHYSPKGRVIIARGADVAAVTRREREAGVRVGALVIDAKAPNVLVARLPADPAGYAAQLYTSMHSLDDAACDVIVVERVPDGAEWFGVRDRLERASRTA